MNKRNLSFSLLYATASLTVGICLRSAPAEAQTRDVKLTILHTNDTHGHLLPFSYPDIRERSSFVSVLREKRDIGGAARRAALVRRIRAEGGHATLVTDSGDLCDGTPFSTEYHGEADVAALNAMGVDLACPGNHEYSNPLSQVKRLIAEAKFPFLSANSLEKATGSPVFTPYTIRTVDGVRIAFFGLMTYDARTYPAAKSELTMEVPLETARKLVPELRKKADLVIALTHIGVEEDMELAAVVPGIDVIVGGHSHTYLPHPILIPHPNDLRPHSVKGTVIVQDYQWGGSLGRLDLTFHREAGEDWTVSAYRGTLLPVNRSLPEDPAVAQVVESYWAPIRAKYGEVLGEAAADFIQKGDDYAEYNLVCDAEREATGAEVVLENFGGVRAPLAQGKITYGDLISMDPFGNTLVTFHATGKQIKAILERYTPAVSGLRYRVERGELKEVLAGNTPIDENRVYSGATNSYYAKFILEGIPDSRDTKKPRLDTTLAFVRKQKRITPVFDGRRRVTK